MVDDDIFTPPPSKLVLVLVEAAAVGGSAGKSNGLLDPWPKPVGFADDDFDEVSDKRASMADDIAPIAGNMAELRQRRRARPLAHASLSKRHATAKTQ